MDYFIFLSNTPSFIYIYIYIYILNNTEFEITKLAHVLNANNPKYQLFRVT